MFILDGICLLNLLKVHFKTSRYMAVGHVPLLQLYPNQ